MSPTKRILAFLILCVYLFAIHFLNGSLQKGLASLEKIEARPGGSVEALAPNPEQIRQVAVAHEAVEEVRFKILTLNCVLMWGILYLGLWPFIRRSLDDGIYGVSESIRVAESRRTDAEAMLQEATDKLEGIDREVEALRVREARAAEDEAERLRELAEVEARQIQEHAESGIRRETEAAQEMVVRRIAGKAVDQALEEVAEEIDDATRSRLSQVLVEGFCEA